MNVLEPHRNRAERLYFVPTPVTINGKRFVFGVCDRALLRVLVARHFVEMVNGVAFGRPRVAILRDEAFVHGVPGKERRGGGDGGDGGDGRGKGKKGIEKEGETGDGWRVRKREMNQTGENGTGKK